MDQWLSFKEPSVQQLFDRYFHLNSRRRYLFYSIGGIIYIGILFSMSIIDYIFGNMIWIPHKTWIFGLYFSLIPIFFILWIIQRREFHTNSTFYVKYGDYMLYVGALTILFFYDNPIYISDANFCNKEKGQDGYAMYWLAIDIQFYNLLIMILLRRWAFKITYFLSSILFTSVTKISTFHDRISSIRSIACYVLFCIMLYYMEKAKRENFIAFIKNTNNVNHKDKVLVKQMFDGLSDSIIIINKDKKIVLKNVSFQELAHKLSKASSISLSSSLDDCTEPEDISNNRTLDQITITKIHNTLNNSSLSSSSYNNTEYLKKNFDIKCMTEELKPLKKFYNDHSITNPEMYKFLESLTISCCTLKNVITKLIENMQFLSAHLGNGIIEYEGLASEYKFNLKIQVINLDNMDCLLLAVNDITTNNQLEQLKQSDKYKDVLLSTVSHELRTPLNSTINMLNSALDDESIPSYTKDEIIMPSLRCLTILLNLVNDILDQAQIKKNQLKLTYQNVDIKQIVIDVSTLIEKQSYKKGLNLIIDVDKDIPSSFYTDPNRLSQILLNLLSNSLKFTKNGYIKIMVKKTGNEDEKLLKIMVEDTGIGISPENQSKLFEEFNKIDLGENEIMNPNGCGLGLNISQKLAITLGPPDSKGLQVYSKIYEGTTFTFIIQDKSLENNNNNSKQSPSSKKHFTFCKPLPLENLNLSETNINNCLDYNNKQYTLEIKPSSKEDFDMENIPNDLGSYFDEGERIIQTKFSATSRDFAKGINSTTANNIVSMMSSDIIKNMKIVKNESQILIVDDDFFNLHSMKMIMNSMNIKCETVNSGELAIKHMLKESKSIKSSQITLIFMDFNMPIMDGLEATRQLKALMSNGEISNVPIIGYTAYREDSYRLQGLEAGMQDVLIKPLTKAKIREVLNISQQEFEQIDEI